MTGRAAHTWVAAVGMLGGDTGSAEQHAADLTARYTEPHRRYHTIDHVDAVVRDAGELADDLGVADDDRLLMLLAACAHDVVYDAQPGADEKRSAAWARERLALSGIAQPHIARVEHLVLATITHDADPQDWAAWAMLDADLAILGADPDDYRRYAAAVRAEFAEFDDAMWNFGRTTVMTGLLERDPLYRTESGRRRWDTSARRNITAELDLLREAARTR
jgi:predicted metal-dependent HD superfamily phosphohydrolase